ncbi:cytochrome c [Bacillus sporothermodurans]|uniref:cytochrome c550 n=1 Tax=Heyndrickxia sporothermodurans TaxID=46224 RepID=UPI00192B86CD|nr:cytochrome c [Heyndrickxia sporothermodurans]MBL5780473.1 cytochrome c [Heyndrickxia sporothermodurans]
MKRNPVIPYLLICVLGIVLVFFLSVKGLGDAKEIAKEKENGGKEKVTEKFEPEAFAKETCIGCHGNNLEGGAGPNLHGLGAKLGKDKVKDVLANGTSGGMPGGLVKPENIDAMADWLVKLK